MRYRNPPEVTWIRMARVAYYSSRLRVMELDERIGQTDAGAFWLMRVRSLGFRSATPGSYRAS